MARVPFLKLSFIFCSSVSILIFLRVHNIDKVGDRNKEVGANNKVADSYRDAHTLEDSTVDIWVGEVVGVAGGVAGL